MARWADRPTGRNCTITNNTKNISELDTSTTTNNSAEFVQVRTEAENAGDQEPSGTTTIVNDGEVVKSSMINQVKLNAGLLSAASTGYKQDIISFLEKPFPVARGVLATTDTHGFFAPRQVFSTITALDIYKQKIKGHLGIRATVVLRLQLNAERFMQGRYIMGFMPMVSTVTGVSGYTGSAARQRQMMFSPTTVTQLPHVQFDLNCDTEAILELPYVSPYSHYSLNTGCGDIGSFFLYPYAALTTGSTGSTSCQYTIWASLKDIDLVSPTLPQADFEFQSAMRPKGMVNKRGTVTEMEQANSMLGPIESVLKKVSKAADVVSQIPLISIVAKQVSWSTDILSRAAHVFGWSRPTSLSPPMRMLHNYAPFWNNPDAADYSMPLSHKANNAVETLPGFAGSNVDELSIDYIKTIPAYYTGFDWNTSQTSGTNLYLQKLAPYRMYTDWNDASNSFITLTPVGFLSRMFANYRGSLKFTFKIVKTEFHSGRLMLSYAPRQIDSNSGYTQEDATYLHREIIDIRLGNEFSFVIPYSSVQTYRSVEDPYGIIQLDVLNELVAPASVNSTVRILVEVAAAPDMEFSILSGGALRPFVPLATQGSFEFQMDANPCAITEGMISDAAMFDDGLTSARFCVGEKIMSLMTLLKRNTWVQTNGSQSFNADNFAVLPFSMVTAESGQGTLDTVHNDYYSVILSCYALSRGGVRWKALVQGASDRFCKVLMPQISVDPAVMPVATINPGVDITGLISLTSYSYWRMEQAEFLERQTPVEVQVPQYGKFHCRVNSELATGKASQPFNLVTPTTPTQSLWFGYAGVADTSFYRSVADDFQVGYFTGVPPMIDSN